MSETAPTFYPDFNDSFDESYIPTGCEDFEHVAELSGSDWEWDRIDFWYSPSRRRYFWYDQAGCSCSGPFEGHGGITLGDFSSGLYADVVKGVLNWESLYWHSTGETQRNQALSNLQKHNAKLRREAPTFI